MAYSVKVRVTSNGGATVTNESVAQGDDTPGNVVAAYGLADPLVVKQVLANDPRLPLSHPEPDEATVTLIGATGATYSFITLGDPVAIIVWPQAAFAGTPVTFYGRVAAMSSESHKLGVKLTLNCVDYTADLRELTVGAGAWPQEDAVTRAQRIMGEAGLPLPSPFRIPAGWLVGGSEGWQAARAAGKTDAYTAMVDTLNGSPVGAFSDETFTSVSPVVVYRRPYVVPKIVGAAEAGLLDEAGPFQLREGAPWSRRVSYAPPARVSNLAGVRTVTVAAADSSPTTGAPIIDGGRVTFAPTFSQRKGEGLANVTTVTDGVGNVLTFDWRTAPSGDAIGGSPSFLTLALPAVDGPAIVQAFTATVNATADPDELTSQVVGYRSPFRPPPASWLVEPISWQAWAEPSPWRRPELTELLTVSRATAALLPLNREWVTGLVSGTTLTISKGRPVIDVDLAPFSYDFNGNRVVKGASLGTASMDSPVLSGVTLAQLAPRDTLADYMIVRGS